VADIKDVKSNSDKTYDGMKEAAEGVWGLGKESILELQKSLEGLIPESKETDIMYREYDGESINDISDDIMDTMNLEDLPTEEGIVTGTFIVTVKHIKD